ncbi:Cytochrome c oxidase assembly factor 6 like [Pseudolycoriella hygida]|uniref:Cytochrome c oxidase assembly factor 6 like n=1 Tax=Pseudolycoriella hygida TaxID=35572 RepID=A0A9Q0RW57_9DIPT|nr:Cytochrome c oxidase assembly factor 6 like [Pseudolycoriella hygida]
MSFPNKDQRQLCWDARDHYWKCLDKNAPKHQSTSGSDEPTVCLQFRKLFLKECPNQWVKHFDRKRTYEQFKEKMVKGYDPMDETK